MMFDSMPKEWSYSEKERVFLTVEKLALPLWQFALSGKYAEWARKVNLQKCRFNFEC